MENRPLKFGARRIFGLDLSKKTLKACRLDEDSGFEKQNIFDEKMTDDGRHHLASFAPFYWLAPVSASSRPALSLGLGDSLIAQ